MPALDGLRGLAVLAVVAYHAGLGGARGGYLGVSAFFTLSGFLITSLLLTEWSARGAVSLRGFWTRRFRRLLPAAVAVIAGVVAVAIVAADSGQLADLRGDVLAGLLYVANWHFVLEDRSYGELFAGPSPLQHLWSLAIEEQFYLLFPLLTVGLLTLGRSRRWVLGLAFAALAAGSVAWSLHLSQSAAGVARAYYDTGARAVELLAGSILAVLVAGRLERFQRSGWRAPTAVLGTVAFVGLLAAWATVPQDSAGLPGGGFALHAAAMSVVLLAAHVPGPVQATCSAAPLRLLGRVSYGVYLVHWPVFVWLDGERTGLDGVALLAVRLAVTAMLTAASYHLVEQPFRRRSAPIRLRGMAVGVASVVVVVLGSVAVTTAVEPADDVVVALDELRAPDTVPVASRTPVEPLQAPATEATETAEVTDATESAEAEVVDQVLLVGDSVMSQAYEHLQARFEARGVATSYAGGPGTGPLAPQGAWATQVQQWIDAVDPDVVVIEACCNYTTEPSQRYVDASGAEVAPGSAQVLPAWETEVRRLMDIAGSRDAQVVLVRFAPVQTNGWYGDIEGHVEAVNALYDRLAPQTGAAIVDWGAVLAPDGAFTTSLPGPDGTSVAVRMSDGVHLTDAGSGLVADATVEAVLASDGDDDAPASRRPAIGGSQPRGID